MAERPQDIERAFRGALLRVCGEMGTETWRSLWFLYDIPERVREGCRSEALDYLLKTGELSCERPEEFAWQLRTNLDHNDLADKFWGEFFHAQYYYAKFARATYIREVFTQSISTI